MLKAFQIERKTKRNLFCSFYQNEVATRLS